MPPIPSEQRSPHPSRSAAVPAANAASGSDHNPATPGARKPPPDFKILLEHEVLALTRLSCVTIWRLERRKAFPRRIKLTGKRVAWLEHEVLGWIADRMAARVAQLKRKRGRPAKVPLLVWISQMHDTDTRAADAAQADTNPFPVRIEMACRGLDFSSDTKLINETRNWTFRQPELWQDRAPQQQDCKRSGVRS